MGKSIEIHLDSFTWKSKKDAEAAFQAILYDPRYNVYDAITDPVHDRMLRELVARHPEGAIKLGKGIDHFFIGRTRDGDYKMARADAIGIWLRRTNGEKEDFGYLAAIRQHSPRSRVKEALRAAVLDRRADYLESRFAAGLPVLSDLTGKPVARADAHVIYRDPSWEQLSYRFAELEGGWSAIALDTGGGRPLMGSDLADTALENRWLTFFDEYAVFQIASGDEANHRPHPDESAWTP